MPINFEKDPTVILKKLQSPRSNVRKKALFDADWSFTFLNGCYEFYKEDVINNNGDVLNRILENIAALTKEKNIGNAQSAFSGISHILQKEFSVNKVLKIENIDFIPRLELLPVYLQAAPRVICHWMDSQQTDHLQSLTAKEVKFFHKNSFGKNPDYILPKEYQSRIKLEHRLYPHWHEDSRVREKGLPYILYHNNKNELCFATSQENQKQDVQIHSFKWPIGKFDLPLKM